MNSDCANQDNLRKIRSVFISHLIRYFREL